MSVRAYLALALALGVSILVWTGPGLVSAEDRIPGLVDSDCNLLFYANRTLFQRCVRAGELPLWNPHDLLGYPIFAAGQTAALYPFNHLLYRYGSVGRSLFADVTLHLLILGLSVAWLATVLGMGARGAWVAAFTVALSPSVLLRIHGGHLTVLSTLAWIPAICAAFIAILRGSRAAIAPAAVFLGLCFHAGHVQLLYYLLAFGGLALAARLVREWDRAAAGRVALALTLGLGLGSIQWLALGELALDAGRRAPSREWNLQFSPRPVDFLAVLGPEAFGDRVNVPYWGRLKVWEACPAFGFTLASLAVVGACVGARAVALPLVGATLAGVLLALGLDFPFQSAACSILPGFGSFRAHARLLLLVVVMLGLLAGLAAEDLARPPARRRRALGLALVLVGFVLLGVRHVGQASSIESFSGIVRELYHPAEVFDSVSLDSPAMIANVRAQLGHVLLRAASIAIALGLVLVIPLGSRQGFVTGAALVVALAIEYLDGSLLFALTSPAPSLDADARRYLEGRPAWSRVHLPPQLPPTMATLLGVDSPGGSVSLMRRHTAELLTASQGQDPARRPAGTVSCVRFDGPARLFGVSRAIGPLSSALVPFGLVQRNSRGAWRFHEAEEPWPRAWIVHRQYRCLSDREALATLFSPGFDPREIAARPVAARPEGEPGVPPNGERDQVRIVARTANTMRLHARLSRPGLVVVADSYDPGWRAFDRTGERAVMRVDHALRGVELEAGDHDLTFVYRPRTFSPGIALTLISGLILVWVGFSSLRSGGGTA